MVLDRTKNGLVFLCCKWMNNGNACVKVKQRGLGLRGAEHVYATQYKHLSLISLHRQEDEEVLERLCSNLSVGKEPRAVLFYKEQGNKRFGRKQYTAAAVLYSKACLEDIDRAQEHGYPEQLQSKIHQRRANCMDKLKQCNISESKSHGTERKCAMNHKQKELKGNPQLTNASCSLKLKFSTPKGRHLVASEDIAQGELLICEEAYVSVIISNRELFINKNTWDVSVTNCDLYCHHCLQRTLAPLPCQHCSLARYCSGECMEQAWKSYHCVECPLGGLLLTFGVFCQTALRTVVVTECREVLNILLHQVSDTFQVSAVEEKPNPPYSSDYKSLSSLLSHSEHHKAEHKFLCALTSAALCKKLNVCLLRSMGTSPPTEDCVSLQDEAHEIQILGSAILLHMLQLHCNAQAVTVIHEEYEESAASLVESNKRSRLSTALFPVLSLLNHSCDPNTSVSFQGRRVLVRAIRSIRKGEDVLHCYGPHKSRINFEKRQKFLKDQYFFACQCEACTEEQRLTDDPFCDFSCPKCNSLLKGKDQLHCVNESCAHWMRRGDVLLRLQNLQCGLQEAQEQLRSNHIDVAIRRLMSCLSEGKAFLSENHMLFGEIFDQLAQAEASKGDWTAAAGHLKKSIELVSQRYGPSSIELGHELFKLAQILFNGRQVHDAMGVILTARDILSVHYGPDNTMVQELQEMRTCLLALPGMSGV